MASEGWLQQELEELDEAEKMIFEAMGDFVPKQENTPAADIVLPPPPPAPPFNGTSSKPAYEVTRSTPVVSDVTSELLRNLDPSTNKKKTANGGFDLPPPPDLDDLIISQQAPPPPPIPPPSLPSSTAPAKVPLVDFPEPPPPIAVTTNHPSKTETAPGYHVMSKAPPPPVMPKPAKNSKPAGGGDQKVSSVTIQLNNTSIAPSKPTVNGGIPPLVIDAPAPPAPKKSEGGIPPLEVMSRPDVPKNIKDSAESELDYYTKTLLSNVANPKDEEFYGYCEKCHGVVEGEQVGCKAFDKVFHITCFNCETCNVSVHGVQFYAVDQKPYCEGCYLKSLEKCATCNELITDKILRATGKAYHPACFKCAECGQSLDGIPFTVDDDDKVHCVDCYHKKYAPRCSVCDEPILPEAGKEETIRIVALDRSFHVNCYKCEKCGIRLASEKEGKGCYPLDDHILCLNCNTLAVQALSK